MVKRCTNATSRELADAMITKTGKRISPRTIRRVRRFGIGRHPVKEKILQSFGQGHMDRRLSFAQQHATDDFHTWLFSDEKLWYIARTGSVHWIRRGDPIPVREVANIRDTLMVWGCVWWGGKSSLHTTRKNITADQYIRILTDHLLPCMPTSRRYKFQHDNASPHTSKKTKAFVAQFGIHMVPEWPAYSPDLNPIEHVLSWMIKYVNGQAPRTHAQLKDAVRAAWDNLSQNVIQGYIGGLPSVCQRVITASGDHI
jgi:hypothetical protein